MGHAGHIARVILDRAERAVRSEEAECQHPGQCTPQPGKWTGVVRVVPGTLGLGCAIPFSVSSTCKLGYTQRTRQATGFVFLSPASEQSLHAPVLVALFSLNFLEVLTSKNRRDAFLPVPWPATESASGYLRKLRLSRPLY